MTTTKLRATVRALSAATTLLLSAEITLLPALSQAPPTVQGIRKPEGKGVSQQSGLSLKLLLKESAPPSHGYVTLNADFESPKPLASDTSVTLQIQLAGHAHSPTMTVEEDLELVAGDTRKRLELRFPAYALGYAMSWDVWVDGRHDKRLSQDHDQYQPVPTAMSQGQNRSEALLRVLSSSPGDAAIKLTTQPGLTVTLTSDTRTIQIIPGNEAELVERELPEDWIEYSSIDIVMTDVASLAKLKADRPRAFQALRTWVDTGGNLWVNDVGTAWESLDQLNDLIGLPALETGTLPVAPEEGVAAGAKNWNFVDLTDTATNQVPPEGEGLVSADVLEQEFPRLPANGATPESGKEIEKYLSDEWFAVRQRGWGTVAAYRSHFAEFPKPDQSPEVARALAFWTERSWTQRHGTDPRFANPAFSNWLIPGVGMAPVLEFQILITLFVIAIGPLNYWLLKRAKRLHLLVVTVPAFAALVTLALLAYGVLADGWADRLRSMSITYIDSETKTAASWSRLSYYSAFAPRDGLTFPRESQIYPIEPGADDGYATPAVSRSLALEWTDNSQRLTRGWLNSRTPTQYLVVENRQGVEGLHLQGHPDGVSGTNHLPGACEWVFAVDDRGRRLEARDVPAGGKFRMSELSEAEASAQLRKILQDREPGIPSDIGESRLPWSMRRRYGWAKDYAGSFDGSLLTDRWSQFTGRDTYEMLALPPRTYLAIAKQSLGTPLGLAGVEEEASVHIVCGEW